ncbi:MAG TPA: M48 family metallopeptidase [Flavobacteriales bacterium]|nr:M48 family metallopeptidase [Flavobacteriales bacterium]
MKYAYFTNTFNALTHVLSKRILTLLVLILIMSGCGHRVPVTNRKQMNLISETELIKMADQQYREFLASAKIVPMTDPRAQMVDRVAKKIQGAVETYLKKKDKLYRIENFKWEVHTVDDPTVNAWCMPGGLIVVYTGILGLVENEDELAVVMGHEISHAIARHGNERMSQGMIAQGIGGTFGVLMGSSPTVGQQLFMQAYGIGSALGILSYSRKHETEADKIGLVFGKMAGYDPNKAISFWTKMSKQGGAGAPEILSTHPSDETRIKNLQEFIPEIDSYIN